MKRMVRMFLAVLLLCVLSACAGAEMSTPTATPEPPLIWPEPLQSTSIPPIVTPYPHTEEKNVWDIRWEWFLQTFSVDDSCAYMPTHLDPVSYTGFLADITGNDQHGDSYAMYHGFTDAALHDYISFLKAWGYTVRQVDCDIPGANEYQLITPDSHREEGCLLTDVRLYHDPGQEFLVIAYPAQDGKTYREWSLETTDGPVWPAPGVNGTAYAMELAPDCSVRLEELSFRKEVKLSEDPAALSAPYHWGFIDDYFAAAEAPGPDSRGAWTLRILPVMDNGVIPCLRISLGEHAGTLDANDLHVALAEAYPHFAHTAYLPMLYAYEQDGVFYPWAEETMSSALWVIFPPQLQAADTDYRVYMRLTDPDDGWISDIRKWTYMDFSRPQP